MKTLYEGGQQERDLAAFFRTQATLAQQGGINERQHYSNASPMATTATPAPKTSKQSMTKIIFNESGPIHFSSPGSDLLLLERLS